MAGSRIVEVATASEWEAKLAESRAFGGRGMVVDFYATWCGPCKKMAPHFQDLSERYTNIVFLKVNVDSLQAVAAHCGVRAMPTFQAFFNGTKVDEVVGGDMAKLKAMVESLNGRTLEGTGRKLGSLHGEHAPQDGVSRREMMAAAAEARLKKLQGEC